MNSISHLRLGPPWTCDVCGGEIVRAEEGQLEWLVGRSPEGGQAFAEGLRLVHHLSAFEATPRLSTRRCQYAAAEVHRLRVRNGERLVAVAHPLLRFLGPNGLARLLALPRMHGVSWEAAAELTRRLHLPGYERARLFVEAAATEAGGELEELDQREYLTQKELARIIAWSEAR